MIDLMLRTATKAQMDSALSTAGIVNVPDIYIDEIGHCPGTFDQDNQPVKPTDTRWHVNVRFVHPPTAALVAVLPTFTPLPVTPYRVFA